MTTFIGTILGDIAFDAVLSENISASSVVTSNPIETGAEINDHIYANPKSYTLNAGVSNTPLRVLDSDIFSSGSTVGESGGSGRRVAAWEILNKLHIAGEPFTVQAGLETLSNMVIVSLDAPNDSLTSGSLFVSATLVEIIVVSAEESQLSAEQLKSIQTKQQATSGVNKGKVSKVPKTEKSLALQAFEMFGGGD